MIDYESMLDRSIIKYNNSNKWANTRFENIKHVSNTSVGNVGQDFLKSSLEALSIAFFFPQTKAGKNANQSPWDICIDGVKYELKTASEDVGGKFQFNHIRYHRKYDAVICIGISPSKIFVNTWSKAEISTGKAGNLVSMEKGANASYKLTKDPKDLFDISNLQACLDRVKNLP